MGFQKRYDVLIEKLNKKKPQVEIYLGLFLGRINSLTGYITLVS